MPSRPSIPSTVVSIYGLAKNNTNEIVEKASIFTIQGNHEVERYGDMGLWDTKANIGVSPDQCLINNKPYPNQ